MSAGNEISVTVNNGAAVAIDVAGATGDAIYVTNGGTAAVAVTSVGDRGPQGDPGPSTNISIGTVVTGAAGSPASASITGVSPSQTLNLVIPRGDTGATGSQGAAGPAGVAASVTVGTVTTGAAGSIAVVTNSGSSSAAVLNFTLPRGDTGTAGTNGREIQLQASATHVQWRYVGDTAWTNLVALADITGPQGPQGPATIAIGTVTTGNAGTSASVTNSGTSSAVVLDFTIPRGESGTAGVSWQPVPMSPSATGTNGDIAYDASFLYVKSASGWRRMAIASWTPLGAPTSVSATAGNTQATVFWTAPVDNGGYTITDYAVQFSSDSGTSWTTFADGTSTATSATVTGLTNGTAYVFRVAAINAAGTGPYSSATSSVTPGVSTDPNFANVSLLLHMDGTNGSTTFTDSSGTPKTVTPIGGAAISAAQSKFGGASGFFDGDGDRLSIPDSDAFWLGSGDYTVEAWLYVTTINTQGGGAFFSQSASVIDNANRQFAFSVNSSGLDVYWTTNGASDQSHTFSATVPQNQWAHVAFSRASGVLRAYLNGVQVGSNLSHAVTYFNSTAPVYVGSFGNYFVDGYGFLDFTGYIDELRITKGVARYTANFTPPAAPFPDA